MVLRGSNVAPDNKHIDVQALKETKHQVEVIESEIEQKHKEIIEDLTQLNRQKTKKDSEKLLETITAKVENVKILEEKKHSFELLQMLQSKEMIKTIKQLICGGTAGAIARTTVAPLDRIKILIQVAHVQKTTHLYPNMWETAKYVIKSEGPLGLWRGNFTNCVRVMPHAATQFVAYDKVKVAMIGSSDGKLEVWQRLAAGSLSGIAAQTVTQPLDVLRIRLQTDPEVKGKMFVAARAMWSEGGLHTFYKGYTPAVLSLAPFIAVNFATFDTLKSWYYGDKKCTKQELKDRNPLVVLSLGALSGIIAQTVCYPLDTVRRRQALKGKIYPSTLAAFTTIFKQEGPIGFYRGMVANALKVMPNNAIRFAAYDILKNYFVEE